MANLAPTGELEDQLRSMILGNVSAPQMRQERQAPIPTNQKRNTHPPHSQQPQSLYQRHPQIQPRQLPNPSNHASPGTAISNSHEQQQQQQRQPHRQQGYPSPTRNIMPQTRQGVTRPAPNGNLQHDVSSTQRSISRGVQSGRGNFRSAPSKFAPLARPQQASMEQFNSQCQYLERIAADWLPRLELEEGELALKDNFRYRLEKACQEAAVTLYSTDPPNIRLAPFGSLSSGFAMPGSDMDLALVASRLTPELPRLFEKALLDLGHGARLLTRTRVPIIKVCELPSQGLYTALQEERQKWDDMTLEDRIKYDQTGRQEEIVKDEVKDATIDELKPEIRQDGDGRSVQEIESKRPRRRKEPSRSGEAAQRPDDDFNTPPVAPSAEPLSNTESSTQPTNTTREPKTNRQSRPWYREKARGPLDFPKSGVGIQCDINFANPLGLHNTLLLRCYSHCDVRVRLMVLFVKAWASRRKINSSYNGTLSSYGYVLMVLHYLVNIAHPPVCPNLQLARRTNVPLEAVTNDPNSVCQGYDVRFWRNESEILALAAKGMLSHNQQPLGVLLCGFFHYYSQQRYDAPHGGFAWTLQVLSLRTPGGLLSKEAKGWTGAKTTMQDNREVRHRYLFCIEDPFEHDHNVARTVTHNGIVAIRDEFRRAWRILLQAARGDGLRMQEGDLFDLVEDVAPPKVDMEEKPVESTGSGSKLLKMKVEEKRVG